MKLCVAVVLLICCGICFAQTSPNKGTNLAAYPESEAVAAWRGLAGSYILKAQKDKTLDHDPALNARVDAVMAAVGAAVAAIDARYADATWKAILIERFGYGAVAFPGETIIVDSKFVRAMNLNDAELALMLSHEVAHVVAGHAAAKLSFMAEFLGKDKVPTARTALIEFLTTDSYATVYLPTAQLQEREADMLGAAIFFATGYDQQRAMRLFDKLQASETSDDRNPDAHDKASVRKQSIAKVIDELTQNLDRRDPDPR